MVGIGIEALERDLTHGVAAIAQELPERGRTVDATGEPAGDATIAIGSDERSCRHAAHTAQFRRQEGALDSS